MAPSSSVTVEVLNEDESDGEGTSANVAALLETQPAASEARRNAHAVGDARVFLRREQARVASYLAEWRQWNRNVMAMIRKELRPWHSDSDVAVATANTGAPVAPGRRGARAVPTTIIMLVAFVTASRHRSLSVWRVVLPALALSALWELIPAARAYLAQQWAAIPTAKSAPSAGLAREHAMYVAALQNTQRCTEEIAALAVSLEHGWRASTEAALRCLDMTVPTSDSSGMATLRDGRVAYRGTETGSGRASATHGRWQQQRNSSGGSFGEGEGASGTSFTSSAASRCLDDATRAAPEAVMASIARLADSPDLDYRAWL